MLGGADMNFEFLSKEDAQAIFAMTRSEWTENVREAVIAGIARAMGDAENPDSRLTMVMATQEGELFVAPEYNHADKPDFIQVSVAFRSPTAEQLSEAKLTEVLELAARQMDPEYEAMGSIDRVEGGTLICFMIVEKPHGRR